MEHSVAALPPGIDYRELIWRWTSRTAAGRERRRQRSHVGRMTVQGADLPSVRDEVQDVTVQACAELGIGIVEVVQLQILVQCTAIACR